ncbi:tRNA epoxyqueuosine(34) reductase QueG [Solemya velesiana gill symbiont]|uniref:Epoxyqueuosine reductase n=1 Tax=Solemya velesiana gill symbiont TaxID=1918948 RepID=A0A1T2KSC5_9GAMM|nr:tRNA epoxyqueuosine(34) reductase QueG [Solemya velesiana gill symbiont]OOZ35732.1 tRNA epoxyqueuosine(34) reductase QueG [Solemya velesiana gill symbiont]
MNRQPTDDDFSKLAGDIKRWGAELGFQQVGICDTDLTVAEARFNEWADQGCHGEMAYMVSHGSKRSRPEELVPGTLRIISVRMDYLPGDDNPTGILNDSSLGYISRYALGRDYHKLMRNRLQKLAKRMEQEVGEFGYRVFVDSAPVLEKSLAEKAGLGWAGKHTNLVNRHAGGWFFLGELYTDLPLPSDEAESNHCGRCQACIDVCPTRAIVAPYQVDARRCISYLTIELHGTIPLEFRPLIGNRVYGCDDCLLACPWNRFAKSTGEQDFLPRHGLNSSQLVDLFAWSEEDFLERMEGSAIRRLGHERWLRNIAVALGNAETTSLVVDALKARSSHPSELVREHVNWALIRHTTSGDIAS